MNNDTLQKLAQEATPGPWLDMASPPTEVWADVRGPGPVRSYVACSCRVADAAFIAAANPQVVLGLLDEIAEARATERRIRDLLTERLNGWAEATTPIPGQPETGPCPSLVDGVRYALDEIARLQAGGCARDQRTTQFCAGVVERDRTIGELRARIAYLEAGLDAIARVTEGNGHCLSTCACNANPDNDCDCGYCAAEDPGPFAADVVSGEADLDGAMKLDTIPTERSPK